MKISETRHPEVLEITLDRFDDERGSFMEVYRAERYAEAAMLPSSIMQLNLTRSHGRVLRGLHFQLPPYAQGKLVQVIRGRIFDVAVDVRRSSARFGQWVGVELSDEDARQLWLPPGFAHGFCVLSSEADVLYQVTQPYRQASEVGIRWNDPAIGITWPIENPILAPKDEKTPLLRDAQLFP